MTDEHLHDILTFPSEPPDSNADARETDAAPSAETEERNQPTVSIDAIRRTAVASTKAVQIGRRLIAVTKSRRFTEVYAAVRRRSVAVVATISRHPRKAALVAGLVICAAIAARWRNSTRAPESEPDRLSDQPILEKVVVYPPQESKATNDAKPKAGPPIKTSANSAGQAAKQGSEPAATAVTDSAQGPQLQPAVEQPTTPGQFPVRTPATPRPVWLTGKIEELSDSPPVVRPTSHIEFPTDRRRVAPVSMRDVRLRRRYRR